MTLTHEDILNYCNYLINKDQVADPISPKEYNSVIGIVNIEAYNRELRRLLELSGGVRENMIQLLQSSYLNDLKDIAVINSSSGMMADISDSIDFPLSMTGKVSFDSGQEWRKFKLVTDQEFTDKINGVWDLDSDPLAFISGNKIYTTVEVSEAKVMYLKIPVKPIFDYCLYQGDYVYMVPGTNIIYNAQTDQYDLYQNLTLLYENVSHLSANPNQVYGSKSVEFAWGRRFESVIVNLIFEKMGINVREQEPIQVSQIKKQEG